jgi:hypothetical protein
MSEKKQQKSKGNPASKRMMNSALKTRRSQSWQRGQERKAERVKAQAKRERKNRDRRALGQPTPWEKSRITRAWRRSTNLRAIHQVHEGES